MSKLHIETEWQNPEGAKGPELRATWARLRIMVDSHPVTRVEDFVSNSNRDAVFGPLYPMAEWIVLNWWNLLNEVSSPRRQASTGFRRRHNLAMAAEGFALPNLFILTEGRRTALDWSPVSLPEHRVRFLNKGQAVVETSHIEDVLRGFVKTVVARLENENVKETFLSEEWKWIESIDREEADFCRAVGRLGMDPYDLENEAVETVIRLWETLPFDVTDEFFSAVDFGHLEAQGGKLTRFLARANELDLDLPQLRHLKDDLKGVFTDIAEKPYPWQQGYAFAKHLRAALLNTPDTRVSSMDGLWNLFGLDASSWRNALAFQDGLPHSINAAVGTTQKGSPCFALRKRTSETGNVFTLCRAIFEYLIANEPSSAVVTQTQSERQKRNRAFAAEFIAPVAHLRDRINTKWVTDEDIQEIADYFGASDFVIRHQIQNYNIARIVEERFRGSPVFVHPRPYQEQLEKQSQLVTRAILIDPQPSLEPGH